MGNENKGALADTKMANFCPNCGHPVSSVDKFCKNCGIRLNTENAPLRQPGAGQIPQGQIDSGSGPVRDAVPVQDAVPQPGFSDRVNHPEILAALRKNRKASKLSMFFIVPLPLIGFVLYAMITGEMETAEALRTGAIVSLVFLVFAVYSFIKNRTENSYEAVVTDKRTRRRADKSTDSRGNRSDSIEYDYITIAKTTDGKTKKIVETDHGVVWAYHNLQVGDRFRYHPQFAFPYELYDKTKADGLYCPACGTKNPLTADRCRKCKVPLLR